MRWLIALAAMLGGCSQGQPNLGLTTGSILPSLAGMSGAPAASKALSPTAGAGGERIGVNLYRVSASDRAIADPVARENYALLRAAETAKAAGGTHFIMIQTGDQSSSGFSLSSTFAGNTGSGNSGQFGAYVRVLTLEPGAEVPIGAIVADEIIHFFGPNFGRTPA